MSDHLLLFLEILNSIQSICLLHGHFCSYVPNGWPYSYNPIKGQGLIFSCPYTKAKILKLV